jgi:5'-methylthioadenosine phosphorylase
VTVKPGGRAADQTGPLAGIDSVFGIAVRTGASGLDFDESEHCTASRDDIDLNSIGAHVSGDDPITSTHQIVGGAALASRTQRDSTVHGNPRDRGNGRVADPMIGVVGGSGIYEIDGLRDAQWRAVESPFGSPSDEILIGRIGETEIAFLPRHGRGHRIPPSEIDYRANIDALKRVGVTDLISIGACGSLREHLNPGTFVLVDQFIDRTFARERTFFSSGLVAHVSMARPVCARLGDLLEAAATELEIPIERGGAYLAMEGPQFSSVAESELYRSWGADVIGMTNMPEAKLAREAEICYASVSMVTDFDCWHDDHDAVEVIDILKVLTSNADLGRNLVAKVSPKLASRPTPCPDGCDRALEGAIITVPEARDPAVAKRLDAVAGRVL